ncbi:MAG: SAM-dependent DNA methyltransferase [Chrysiogenetes bacterium]|nr:SAM-dependent DNA methyltransferase [Chrysiogenetes bacterium]
MKVMTTTQLFSHIWKAADILRGSIDSSDYKGFIFAMMFLKRASDVFDEEAERILKETGDEKLAYDEPDEHPIFVPRRARWEELRKKSAQIGDALNKACEALEEANPTLEGVLAGIDFNDEHRLGDAKQRDTLLARLILHFSEVSLRNDALPKSDVLGDVYEYLIEKFADDAGKKGGEFYTPHGVVKLLVELLDPKEGMRICDPTCGSGGMLIECARHVKGAGGNVRNLSLYGQEKNLGTWSIAKMNLIFHGIRDARIEKGDTIAQPKLLEQGELMLFDRVIANPPFSLKEWGRTAAEADRYGRFRFGIPPASKGDMAFLQHMVASLNSKGMMGVVMPHGVLFRGASEGKIREEILKEDLLEAVIGLPPNLFYGTGIPAAILILRAKGAKPRGRKGKVLFIHATEGFESAPNQNKLREQDIARIVAAFRAFKDEEKFARAVPLEEIAQNAFNLNISRYVDLTEEEEIPDVREALKALREAEKRRDEAEKKMNKMLKELGFEG